MSSTLETACRILVDPSNPGQFFACCGLLELADRLWGGAEGWYRGRGFFFAPLDREKAGDASFDTLLDQIAKAALRQVDPLDVYSSPLDLPAPFGLRLDWWKDGRAGGRGLKVWAGTMSSVRIARAMQNVLSQREVQSEALLDHAAVVYDPLEKDKKVEPFYFDARRGAASQPIDIGFSTDPLKMSTLAYPAVEFLCLVGLQRFRPMPTNKQRVFDYYTWEVPLDARTAPAAAVGLLPGMSSRGFRFEVAFRTDQKKHKAFTPATTIRGADRE